MYNGISKYFYNKAQMTCIMHTSRQTSTFNIPIYVYVSWFPGNLLQEGDDSTAADHRDDSEDSDIADDSRPGRPETEEGHTIALRLQVVSQGK
jgi:hypothetical protein